MKTRHRHHKNRLYLRICTALTAIALMGAGVGCTTSYDRYGRPIQTVDPGVALVGVAAAGIIGYAIANDGGGRRHGGHGGRHGGYRHDDYGYGGGCGY